MIYKQILKNAKIKDNKYNEEKIVHLTSVISIFLNVFLAMLKFVIGIFTSSVSVMADSLNNFSDALCSFFTTIAFNISKKPQDENHPFGHGRLEYVITLIISIIIILIGFQFLKTSIEKIFNPKTIKLNLIGLIFLLIATFIKLWLYHLNKKLFKKFDLKLLKAVSIDSFTDSLITIASIFSLMLSNNTILPIDSLLGIFISFIILYQGFTLSKDTISDLLGSAPKKELVKKILEDIKNHKEILNLHNFNLHSYGNKKIASIDIEIDEKMTVDKAHSIMSIIEKEIFEKYEITLITHIEPYRKNLTLKEKKLREKIKIFKNKNDFIKSLHDFEINEENNFVCLQLVLDGQKLTKNYKEEKLKKEIEDIIKDYDKNLKTSITILYEYI